LTLCNGPRMLSTQVTIEARKGYRPRDRGWRGAYLRRGAVAKRERREKVAAKRLIECNEVSPFWEMSVLR